MGSGDASVALQVPGAGRPAAAELLARARALAAELAPGAAEHDRSGTFAQAHVDAVWRAGLGNLTLPASLGGPGADLRTTVAAVRLLAAGDPSTALVLVMHLAHLRVVVDPASGFPPALRERIVADGLAGPALINALRVEPDLGTPARGGVPATTARPAAGDGGEPGWRVRGRKVFSTGAPGLHWLLVWGATSADAPGGQRVGWLVVPGGSPGVTIEPTWDHLGMRATGSHDVVLDGVWIPEHHAVGLQAPGGPGRGRDVVLVGWLTTLLLAVYRGVAQAARDWLVRYLGERVPSNLGAPLASLPRMQEAVGEIEAHLYTADRVLDALAGGLDRGGADAARAAEEQGVAKAVVTRALVESVSLAVGLVGNAGLTHHHPLQRHYRDVLCSRIHTPQDDASLLAAGRAALLP